MKETSIPGKFAQWKRPLAGGLISAGVMLFFAIPFLFSIPSIQKIFFSLYQGFMVSSMFTRFLPFLFHFDFWISLLFWFAAGWMIVHLIKDNKIALLHWSVLYLAAFIAGQMDLVFAILFMTVFFTFGILYYSKGMRTAVWTAGILAIVFIVLSPILVLMLGCIIAGPYCI